MQPTCHGLAQCKYLTLKDHPLTEGLGSPNRRPLSISDPRQATKGLSSISTQRLLRLGFIFLDPDNPGAKFNAKSSIGSVMHFRRMNVGERSNSSKLIQVDPKHFRAMVNRIAN